MLVELTTALSVVDLVPTGEADKDRQSLMVSVEDVVKLGTRLDIPDTDGEAVALGTEGVTCEDTVRVYVVRSERTTVFVGVALDDGDWVLDDDAAGDFELDADAVGVRDLRDDALWEGDRVGESDGDNEPLGDALDLGLLLVDTDLLAAFEEDGDLDRLVDAVPLREGCDERDTEDDSVAERVEPDDALVATDPHTLGVVVVEAVMLRLPAAETVEVWEAVLVTSGEKDAETEERLDDDALLLRDVVIDELVVPETEADRDGLVLELGVRETVDEPDAVEQCDVELLRDSEPESLGDADTVGVRDPVAVTEELREARGDGDDDLDAVEENDGRAEADTRDAEGESDADGDLDGVADVDALRVLAGLLVAHAELDKAPEKEDEPEGLGLELEDLESDRSDVTDADAEPLADVDGDKLSAADVEPEPLGEGEALDEREAAEDMEAERLPPTLRDALGEVLELRLDDTVAVQERDGADDLDGDADAVEETDVDELRDTDAQRDGDTDADTDADTRGDDVELPVAEAHAEGDGVVEGERLGLTEAVPEELLQGDGEDDGERVPERLAHVVADADGEREPVRLPLGLLLPEECALKVVDTVGDAELVKVADSDREAGNPERVTVWLAVSKCVADASALPLRLPDAEFDTHGEALLEPVEDSDACALAVMDVDAVDDSDADGQRETVDEEVKVTGADPERVALPLRELDCEPEGLPDGFPERDGERVADMEPVDDPVCDGDPERRKVRVCDALTEPVLQREAVAETLGVRDPDVDPEGLLDLLGEAVAEGVREAQPDAELDSTALAERRTERLKDTAAENVKDTEPVRESEPLGGPVPDGATGVDVADRQLDGVGVTSDVTLGDDVPL